MMKTRVIPLSSKEAIPVATDVVRSSGVIAFPTDTVYGLAASAWDAIAIRKLFHIKGRDFNKAIAVLIGSRDQVQELVASFPSMAAALADTFWPGALTIIVKRSLRLPGILTTTAGIGIRLPDLDFTRQLLQACGPLATTSANLSGEANCLDADEVLTQLSDKFDLLIDGGHCPGGTPSTVVDCQGKTPRILRVGALSELQIINVVKKRN
jgi:L-threonylcarbamoyladenylate synthase